MHSSFALEVTCSLTLFKSFLSFDNPCSRPGVFCKKGVIKKETLGQVFSCEFCEISKNAFPYRTTLVAATENSKKSRGFHITKGYRKGK